MSNTVIEIEGWGKKDLLADKWSASEIRRGQAADKQGLSDGVL